jgi:hypothetical protein
MFAFSALAVCHWPVGIRVVIHLVLAFVIFWASLDAGADLRRAAAPVQRRGGDLRLGGAGVPHDVRTRGGPRLTERTLSHMPLPHVDLPEMDAESHADESITGDLMTRAW